MKFGIDQRNRPVPIWFKRLRDASVNFLLPGLGQLVASLNLTPESANIWLQALTFIPMLFNFVGVLLGEDVKKKIRVWVLLIGAASLMAACKSPAKLQARQEQKDRDYLRGLQTRIVDHAIYTPPITVPGGVIVKGYKVPCRDSIIEVDIPCPPVTINLDSLIRNSEAYKDLLVKAALAVVTRDSTATENATLTADKKRLKKERDTSYWIIGGIVVAGIGLALFRFKSIL